MNINNILEKCRFPDNLSEKHTKSLYEAVKYILERYNVSGIIATGTIINGNDDPSSDLDIYVINKEPFRQRIHKFFNFIPAEIFVNPPSMIERYFEEDYIDKRQVTAHMLATGFIVLSIEPIINELIEKAKSFVIKIPPKNDPKSLLMQKYGIATLYEDALDLQYKDPLTSEALLIHSIFEMLKYYFNTLDIFIPRNKDVFIKLLEVNKNLFIIVKNFYSSQSFKDRFEIAEKIAELTINVKGFFEWETDPDFIKASSEK